MEPLKTVKETLDIGDTEFRIPLQLGNSKDFEEEYSLNQKFIKARQITDLDNLRVPYTIEEILAIRKKIDVILLSSQRIAAQQSIALLNQLYKKISFKMALLTLIRTKPVTATLVIGLLIMALSMIGFLLNSVFREPFVSPFLILYFFYFGLIMAAMAFLERAQRGHDSKQKRAL